MRGKSDIFEGEGSRIAQELRQEAATRIQRWLLVSSLNLTQDSSSSEYSETVACAGCGGSFSQNADHADACDTCGILLHAACGHQFHNLIENYKVCATCAKTRRESGEEAVQSDTKDHGVLAEAIQLEGAMLRSDEVLGLSKVIHGRPKNGDRRS